MTNPAKFAPYLNSDATILYATDFRNKGELVTKEQINKSPYNTYTYTGLPPTPISNPGLDSLDAALEPADTGNKQYFYFVYDKSIGAHRFSESLKEHQSWIDKLGLE